MKESEQCRQLAQAFPDHFEWNEHRQHLRFEVGDTIVAIEQNDHNTVSAPWLSATYPISPELGLAALTWKCEQLMDGHEEWLKGISENGSFYTTPEMRSTHDSPWAALLASVEATDEGE